jgi:hypothetical protein
VVIKLDGLEAVEKDFRPPGIELMFLSRQANCRITILSDITKIVGKQIGLKGLDWNNLAQDRG